MTTTSLRMEEERCSQDARMAGTINDAGFSASDME
jgi:hypothetical protein